MKDAGLEKPSAECPLGPCVQLLAGAWTLEIIYHLQTGPKRFGQLRRSLGTVSSKVMTSRLRALEEKGVLNRKVLPTTPPMVEYSLTRLGLELIPILEEIQKVGKKLSRKYSKTVGTRRTVPG